MTHQRPSSTVSKLLPAMPRLAEALPMRLVFMDRLAHCRPSPPVLFVHFTVSGREGHRVGRGYEPSVAVGVTLFRQRQPDIIVHVPEPPISFACFICSQCPQAAGTGINQIFLRHPTRRVRFGCGPPVRHSKMVILGWRRQCLTSVHNQCMAVLKNSIHSSSWRTLRIIP